MAVPLRRRRRPPGGGGHGFRLAGGRRPGPARPGRPRDLRVHRSRPRAGGGGAGGAAGAVRLGRLPRLAGLPPRAGLRSPRRMPPDGTGGDRAHRRSRLPSLPHRFRGHGPGDGGRRHAGGSGPLDLRPGGPGNRRRPCRPLPPLQPPQPHRPGSGPGRTRNPGRVLPAAAAAHMFRRNPLRPDPGQGPAPRFHRRPRPRGGRAHRHPSFPQQNLQPGRDRLRPGRGPRPRAAAALPGRGPGHRPPPRPLRPGGDGGRLPARGAVAGRAARLPAGEPGPGRRRGGADTGPGLHPPQATYLAWVDARAWGWERPAERLRGFGVEVWDGSWFGVPGYFRVNFGCPRSLLSEGLRRIAAAVPEPCPPVS